VLLTRAEDVPDAVERVVAAPAVTGRLLLDAAAYVINDRSGELHDMERVEHGTGVLELVVDGVLLTWNGPRVAILTPAGRPHPARRARSGRPVRSGRAPDPEGGRGTVRAGHE
jgi:hypothetical protein